MVEADCSVGLRLRGRILDARPGTGASLAAGEFEYLVLGDSFAVDRRRLRSCLARRSIRDPVRVSGSRIQNLSSYASSQAHAKRRSPLFGLLCTGEVPNGARTASISLENLVGTACPRDPL